MSGGDGVESRILGLRKRQTDDEEEKKRRGEVKRTRRKRRRSETKKCPVAGKFPRTELTQKVGKANELTSVKEQTPKRKSGSVGRYLIRERPSGIDE
jgi:hypothetical protein